MRIRTICAGVALVVAALLLPSGIRAGLLVTECTAAFNGPQSCGDPGTPLAKGAGLLREAAGSPMPVDPLINALKLADVDGDGALDVVLIRSGIGGSGLTELSKQILGRPIPIVLHGYDYPIPDGRGFLGGFFVLPGPWLEPGFHKKGYADVAANAKVMRDLIDSFNAMLKSVGSAPQFTHVTYLDLRGTLETGSTYKKDWANELHPTAKGFSTVAAKFAAVIDTL